ncbi:MAG: hypothetical protein BWK76_21005 [Desulfobulbaceae bacterium A2]|nr:MAG: hypothetical protein BWK76_21005 [Desulfobulbaceae bacterium A2]
MKRRRCIRCVLAVLLGVTVLVGALLVVLLTTEPGGRWLLARVQTARPAQLRYARFEGRLLGPLTLHELTWSGGGVEVAVARLHWDWHPLALLHGQLDLGDLRLEELRLTLPTDDRPPAPELMPEMPPPPLPVRLRSLEVAGFELRQGATGWRLDSISLAGALDAAGVQLELGRLQHGPLAVELSGRLAAAAPHALTVQLRWQAELPGLGALAGEGKLAGDLTELRLETRLTAPLALHVDGTVQPAQGPRFDLVGEWNELRWPLDDASQARSSTGRFRLSGSADDYQLALSGPLELTGVPALDLDLAATGNRASLQAQQLSARFEAGSLVLAGHLSWSPRLEFSCEIQGQHIDPARFHPDWPGELSLAGRLVGTAPETPDGAWHYRGQLEQLQGTLRGFPLSASGGAQLAGEVLDLDDIRLNSGVNRLELSGRLADVIDLSLAIQAPDLSSLLPGLAGSLVGAGRLSGTWTEPRLQGDFSGQGLAWQDQGLARFMVRASWAGEDEGQLQVNGDGLRSGALRLERVEAELRGGLSRHELDLRLRDAAGHQLLLAAAGGWQEEAWKGELRDLLLAGDPVGRWQLAAAVPLTLALDQLETGAFSLSGPDGASLAGEGRWHRDAGVEARARLQGLRALRFSPWLPEGMELGGVFAGQLEIRGASGSLQGDGRLAWDDAVLVAALENESPLRLPLSETAADFSLSPDSVGMHLSCGLPLDGSLQAELSVATAGNGASPLRGRLTARLPDISLLAGFLSRAAGLTGEFTLDAELGGTTSAPQWAGDARLNGLAARLPELGLFLTEGWLRLAATAGEAPRIEGAVRSGEGELRVEGQFNPGPGFAWPLSLRLTGDNLMVADLPEARVWASPDLRLERLGAVWHLDGRVRVPQARFALEDLPHEVVRRSADEVLVGTDSAVANGKGNGSFRMRLQLDLGEDVQLHGFGLTSRLTGSVQAKADEGLTTLDGQLNLVDGRYDAYGQRLVIEQGRLIFTGPATDPGLDLRATRPLPDSAVKPYLHVRGHGRAPRVTVSSEPPLPEADALAYLLTGRALNRAGQQEGSAMAEAALAMGVSRAEPWLRQLGAKFGFDTLEVQSTTGAWGKSAVAVGTYLNPDVYLGYAAGLFDPGGAMLLRLRLSERLELETRAGTQSSADVFYRFERK